MVIRESDSCDRESSDSELSDWQKDNMGYAKQMVASSDRVDRQLVNLYLISLA